MISLLEENSCTRGVIPLLDREFLVQGESLLYWKDIFCARRQNSLLEGEFLYWGTSFCTGRRVRVQGESALHWKDNSCTRRIISLLEEEFLRGVISVLERKLLH